MKSSGIKLICVCMVFIFLSLVTVSCSRSSGNTVDFNTIKSYKDIPGVTQDEIDAIEALKLTRDSFIYAHSLETEAYMLPDGTFTGFLYSFCELLTELFGIDFNGKYYEDWEDLLGGFNRMESDFTGALTASPERMLKYHMTRPIADRTLGVFTHIDSDKLQTEMDINGLTVGFITNTITADLIKSTYPVSFEIIEIDGLPVAAEMLRTGEIDAFITASVVDPSFLEYDFIKSKIMFPLAYTSASMSTANPELKPIISVVNKYLAAGGIDKLVDLYKKNGFEYDKYKLSRSLTDEEQAYISNLVAQNQKVKAALEYDNYPISFYNNNEKQFQGIAIDILREISNLTGIEFESATKKETTWGEVLEKVYSGEISIVTQMFYSDLRINDYIWSKVPYNRSRYALLSKTEHPDYTFTQIARLRVGAMDSSLYTTMYNLWFPNLDNLSTYQTLDDGFEALEKNEIDLLMTAENMLLTQTNYREKPGYKVNMSFDSPIESIFGLNKNETVLCSIIDKAQAFINIDTISDNWTTRTFNYDMKLAAERMKYLMIFAAVLSVIFLAMIWLLVINVREGKRRKAAEEEARLASMTKSEFLVHISHEIRTPLNAIVGMSDIAKKSISNQEKVLFSINHIISSSHHLLSIINDVLDMSKIESGKLKLTHQPFRLLDAYDEVIGMITQRCEEKNIRFISNMKDMKNITLIGDKLRVNQVLINLLGNAIKFTYDSGNIEFSIRVLEEDKTSIRLEFSISDNGIGIAEEQIIKLFTPFEQGDSSITSSFGGTGLGLAISQNIVTAFGGRIEVESKLGVGTRFYFNLLFEKGDEIIDSAAETPDTVDFSNKRILLIEDVDINRLIVCELLSSTGVFIDEAEDGQQGVDMFENSPIGYYNLIFMDIQMPVMNGYDATKKIRKLDREDSKSVPIIAMTANAYNEDVEKSLASGMNNHLSKPIDVSAMMDILRQFLLKNTRY